MPKKSYSKDRFYVIQIHEERESHDDGGDPVNIFPGADDEGNVMPMTKSQCIEWMETVAHKEAGDKFILMPWSDGIVFQVETSPRVVQITPEKN